MFLLLAIWLVVRAVEVPRLRPRLGLLAGAAAGLFTLFWLPYILGIPAVLAVAYLWGERPNVSASNSGRQRPVIYAFCSIVLVIGAGYILAILQLHISSVSLFWAWVAARLMDGRNRTGWSA
jgi:hypothetical protein